MRQCAVKPRVFTQLQSRVTPRSGTQRVIAALAAAVAAASVGLLSPSTAVAVSQPTVSYRQTTVLHPGKTPRHGLLGDLVYADTPTHRLYFADSAKAEIDVWDTGTNHFLGAMRGGFTGLRGLPASFDHLGPNGVLVDNRGQIWAGNGDGTVKVGSTTTLAETHSIVTGHTKADELGYDPEEHIIIATNPSNSPPRVTLINAVSHRVTGHIVIPNAAPDTIEQPNWDPLTERFLVAVGSTSKHPNGEIAVIDPKTRTLDKVFALREPCAPAGLAIGPRRDVLLGCSRTGPMIVDRVTGVLRATFRQACCADQAWYNASNHRYYVAEGGNTAGKKSDPVVLVINARHRRVIAKIRLGLSHDNPIGVVHAVTAASGHVYVPETDGIHVFTQQRHPRHRRR